MSSTARQTRPTLAPALSELLLQQTSSTDARSFDLSASSELPPPTHSSGTRKGKLNGEPKGEKKKKEKAVQKATSTACADEDSRPALIRKKSKVSAADNTAAGGESSRHHTFNTFAASSAASAAVNGQSQRALPHHPPPHPPAAAANNNNSATTRPRPNSSSRLTATSAAKRTASGAANVLSIGKGVGGTGRTASKSVHTSNEHSSVISKKHGKAGNVYGRDVKYDESLFTLLSDLEVS